MKRNFGFTFGRTEKSHNQDYQELLKRLEQEEKESLAKQKTQKKTSKSKKTSPSTPITLPNSDMQFITDKNLYDEIKKYFQSKFPNHEDIFNKLVWNDSESVAKGSNSYIATAVGMFLKQNRPEYTIARQAEIETNLEMFKDYNVDSGLA